MHPVDEASLRQNVSNAARQLWMKGLLVADGGMVTAEVHRRRYLVTPPGKRRSEMQDDDLRMCDIGGQELGGGIGLDEAHWRVHRIAYQISLERIDAPLPGKTAPGPILATVQATPPMLVALLRLTRPPNGELQIVGLPLVIVVDDADEAALRRALGRTSVVGLARSGGILCATGSVWDAVNVLERLEHAATIEVACRQKS
jgi:ribulose-5-phosphate 4-epimerase/fuculose-1-phosphate aldolase